MICGVLDAIRATASGGGVRGDLLGVRRNMSPGDTSLASLTLFLFESETAVVRYGLVALSSGVGLDPVKAVETALYASPTDERCF